MLTAKRITALLSMVAVLTFMAFPVMAAELSVKENRTRSGIVNVAVPYISGSVGGKHIDDMVNQAVLSYVNSQMKQVLSRQETETFEGTHPEPRELSDMLHYNTDLVKYTDKKIVDKNAEGRVTASWYVHNEYEVKSAKDTFYSVLLKTKMYTGGSGNVIVWKAMNFDLKDGHLMELKELFDSEADYAARLQTLIGYQQKGRARLIRHIKGRNVPEPGPVVITGQESFYVDDHYNLGLILYPGTSETIPAPVAGDAGITAETPDKAVTDASNQSAVNRQSGTGQMEVYDISLNDFADLIKL